MILTVTPNPSLDLLFSADRLVWDDANRIDSPRRRAGGQGINLARAVAALGGDTRAVALLGGATGADLTRMLRGEGLALDAIGIDGETRIFAGVRERGTSRSMLLNSRGPTLPESDARRLLAAVEAAVVAHRPRWLVCSGSIPPGLPADLYARPLAIARDNRAAYVVDCDGPPLRAAAERGCDVLSPNAAEAERLLEVGAGAIHDAATAAGAARAICARFGARVAFVTLGVEGAVAADASGAWYAPPPEPDSGESAVGAGDAFLAGALLSLDRGEGADEAVRAGVAAGSAVLRSRGSDLLTRADYDELLQKTSARRIG